MSAEDWIRETTILTSPPFAMPSRALEMVTSLDLNTLFFHVGIRAGLGATLLMDNVLFTKRIFPDLPVL